MGGPVQSGGFQDGHYGRCTAEEMEPAVVGGNMLMWTAPKVFRGAPPMPSMGTAGRTTTSGKRSISCSRIGSEGGRWPGDSVKQAGIEQVDIEQACIALWPIWR